MVGLLSSNPLLTAACLLTVPVFFKLLWRPGETPVLLFAVSFQWLQVSASVFHADILGVPLAALYTTETVYEATLAGLIGLLVLSVGMHLGLRKVRPVDDASIEREVNMLSPDILFVLYLIGAAGATVLMSLSWIIPGAAQVLRGVAEIKWVFFCLLGYVVLKRKDQYLYLAVAVGIEFVAGIGFFSGFKTVIFMSLIVLFTVYHRLKPGTLALGSVAFVVLLIVGLAWTAVKDPYRDYLNQGTGMQQTLVSRSDQLTKLAQMVGNLRPTDLLLALDPLFDRIAYIEYFAITRDYVPEVLPHEGGFVWSLGIKHVLMPRILFPDKPPLIPDSDVTMRYTGLQLASEAEGTSISIGYMGDSYIDFGPYGMYGVVFLLGLLWGVMYYYFRSRTSSILTGYAFATTLLINAYQFEISSTKLIGGVTSKFVMLLIMLRFAEPLILSLARRRRQPTKAKTLEPTSG